APAVVGAPPHQPVTVRRVAQHLVRHRAEIWRLLRQYRTGRQADERQAEHGGLEQVMHLHGDLPCAGSLAGGLNPYDAPRGSELRQHEAWPHANAARAAVNWPPDHASPAFATLSKAFGNFVGTPYRYGYGNNCSIQAEPDPRSAHLAGLDHNEILFA